MAIIHQATLTPSKTDIVAAWLPSQPWFDGPAETVRAVGAYRFDDPAGEVGIESHLLDVDGRLVHVPLTYRAAELPGAEEWLLGTMQHSVLGTRWVYDAAGDPVYRDELVRVVREGGTHVRLFVETPDGPVEREPSAAVRGSGTGAEAGTGTGTGTGTETGAGPGGDQTVVVVRFPSSGTDTPSTGTLTGTWAGQDESLVLAYLPT